MESVAEIPLPFVVVSLILMVLVLAADVTYAYLRPHVPSTRECALFVAFYAVLALIFGGMLFVVGDANHGTEFLAGWLTEYSLSIDNLFVFIVIMTSFQVPKKYQQEVLMIGIILALVFRGIFILIGAQLIASFSWIFYIFGAFLIYTAYTQAFGKSHDRGPEDSRLVKFLRNHIELTPEYHGGKIRTVIDGKKVWTPILVVLVSLGATDLLFALDSIPAIFGITESPFIVFAANVFALMGLRQLYFLLGDLVERLIYLKYGIAFILAFIGVKLILHALHENELPFLNGGEHITAIPEIGTGLSLIVIVAAMTVATVASLLHARREGGLQKVEPQTGPERHEPLP